MSDTVSLQEESGLQRAPFCLSRYASRQPALFSWAEQIRQVSRGANSSLVTWSEVGHGLIVADPDTDDFQSLLMSVAHSLNGQYRNLTFSEFLENADALVSETVPSVVFIEPGAWLDRKDQDPELGSARKRARKALLNFHHRQSPVTVVSEAPSFGDIPCCFRYENVFDRHILWEDPKPRLIAQDLYDQVGTHNLSQELNGDPDRLGRVLCMEFPSVRRVGMLSVALRRRALLEGRQVGWRDLIEICANGTGEGFQMNEHLDLARVAVHEAGHAVVIIAGSGYQNVPDMVTVAPGNGSVGIAVESYHHNFKKRGGNLTFDEARQRICVCLAGRAAEELEYGIGGCSAYAASSDLENASRMAVELILRNGFSADYYNPKKTGSNLFVVLDESDIEETKYYDLQLRSFLEKLYEETKEILASNKALFEAVRKSLLGERYLMREDLQKILSDVRHRS